MAENDSRVVGFMKTIVEELKNMASTETVIGEPITIEGKTIIPVVKVFLGFGAGGGEGSGMGKEKEGKGEGAGAGGGGGIKVDPVAFLVVSGEETSLLPVSKLGFNIERLMETFPEVVGKLRAAIKGGSESKEKEEEK